MKRIIAKGFPCSLKGRHFPTDVSNWERRLFQRDDVASLATQLYFIESQQTEHLKPKSKQEFEAEETKQEFQTLVKVWTKATSRFSFVRQQIVHPSFLRIIGMGEKALPLILEEVKERPIPSWFTALEAISGKDVASDATNIGEAAQCWIRWGQNEGYLKS
ncbi:MAG: hypothetical protein M3R14_04225 [Acidobacteriota bacterium]|nr:hypothetical protein [Acidobacteriota bacterium]